MKLPESLNRILTDISQVTCGHYVQKKALIWALVLVGVIPGAVQAEIAAQTSMERDSKAIVIIGASYARSWPIRAIADLSVVNAGIGGNQSFEMAERFEQDVLVERPETVIIWGFINDLFRSDPSKIESTKTRIKQSFEEMVVAAEDQNIEVILATEVLIREPTGIMNWLASLYGKIRKKPSYQSLINEQVREVNDWLRQYSASKEIKLLDFEHFLAGPDGSRQAKYASADGSHLSSAAYDVLTAHTKEALDRGRSANKPR